MEFIRTSASRFGNSKNSCRAAGVPVVCTVEPRFDCFLPRTQFGEGEIVRCLYCKAFISLFCEVISNEFKWRCALCLRFNSISPGYSRLLNSQRNELEHSNYEIYADENYIKKTPASPNFLFLVDVSDGFESLNRDTLEIISQGILNVIENSSFCERTQVCFLLFDENLHFVDLKQGGRIISVPAGEVWIPLTGLLANLQECLKNVLIVLEALPKFRGSQSCSLRPALEAASELLLESGGKVFIFLFNHYLEAGHPRELSLQPTSDYFHSLSEVYLKLNISLDIFTSSLAYSGLVNLSNLSSKTGGEVYFYKELITSQLLSDISQSISKPRVFEVLAKLRTSTDWRVSSIFGNFSLKNDVLVIPDLTDQSFTYELSIVNEIASSQFIFLQFSMIFTSFDGIRLIRVLNLKLPLTNSHQIILESLNQDVLINFFLKQGASLMYKRDSLIAGQKYLKIRHSEIKKAFSLISGESSKSFQDFSRKMAGLKRHELFKNTIFPCNV
jgi:protein transport protein SEC24